MVRTVGIRRVGLLALIVLGALAAPGCGMPRDPKGTLERVRGGVVRVGVSHSPPWTDVRSDGEPRGREVDLVRGLAGDLGARVSWVVGGETALMEDLARFELDLVIGGITQGTAWKGKVGLTRPHAHRGKHRYVFACPPGENGWLSFLDHLDPSAARAGGGVMRPAELRELPPGRRPALRRAVRLEVLTLAYLASVIVLIVPMAGSSQIIKADLIELLLSSLVPIAFLAALPFRDRPANERFPYGFHRVTSIGFLVASTALFAVGVYIFIDSATGLARGHRPTIPNVEVFGHLVWMGWLMLPVLAWSAAPAVFLGRAKMGPARALHDKVLYADAEMNRADWKTGIATIVGVLLIALGFWWADAVAAILVSIDIVYDGQRNLRAVVLDLIDRQPHTVDDAAAEGLPARVATELEKLPWVRSARVRLRECGHIFFGEVFIEPADHRDLMARIGEARERIQRLDWRVQEVAVQLEDGTRGEAGKSGAKDHRG